MRLCSVPRSLRYCFVKLICPSNGPVHEFVPWYAPPIDVPLLASTPPITTLQFLDVPSLSDGYVSVKVNVTSETLPDTVPAPVAPGSLKELEPVTVAPSCVSVQVTTVDCSRPIHRPA